MNWTDLFIAILGSTVLSSIITWFLGRKKNQAETDNYIVESTTKLIQPLNDRIDQLEKDNCEKVTQINKLYVRICDLEAALALKDQRIRELEQAEEKKEKRIAELEAEIITLRHQIEVLENKKGR
jgi:chromosome segregation ATPase